MYTFFVLNNSWPFESADPITQVTYRSGVGFQYYLETRSSTNNLYFTKNENHTCISFTKKTTSIMYLILFVHTRICANYITALAINVYYISHIIMFSALIFYNT